ncbi:MAG: PQQ-dependent sugar dehydrogenase [Verrucomicrobiota bacterium]
MKTVFRLLPFLCLLPVPSLFAAFPALRLEVVCEKQLNSPVTMLPSGDGSGRLFIAEQTGKIRIFKNGMLLPGNFLDLSAAMVPLPAGYDERGLLGLAFHPGYATAGSPGAGKFYVFFNAPSPNAPGTTAEPVNCRSVLREYRVSTTDPERADPATARDLLTFDKPQSNHNGGCLQFGPDGFLYITTGDGGGSNDNQGGHTGGGPAPRPTNGLGNSQDLTRLMGKMLRVDPLGTNGPGGQYGIPATNPHAGAAGGIRAEIYARGLRNPWRFSFDDGPGGTGRLFAADVGQGRVEEINLITPGGNFGWRNREGTFVPDFSTDAPALTDTPVDPVAQYAHPGITIGTPALPQYGISVTGGFVYRGTAIPALAGKYVFADWSQTFGTASGRMLGLEESAPGSGAFTLSELPIPTSTSPLPYFVQGFGRDQEGELYVLAKTSTGVSAPDPATGLPGGVILKIVPPIVSGSLTLTPSKDNSLYEEGNLSNGSGDWLFAGATEAKNDYARRRALLAFDLSAVPAGAVISSASLALRMDKTITGTYDFSLHRMSGSWGEGTANTGGPEGNGIAASATDATWLKPVHGQAAQWATPGGDFVSTKSATQFVNAAGTYNFSNNPQLTADVNAWLANPASNFGWVLKPDFETVKTTATGLSGQKLITVASVAGLLPGMPVTGTGTGITPNSKITSTGINAETRVITLSTNNAGAVSGEVVFAAPSAKRFPSRTHPNTAERPKLTLQYSNAPVPTLRQAWEKQYYFIGEFVDDAGDTDGDGLPNGIEYAWGMSPLAPNTLSEGLTVDSAKAAAGQPVEAGFRRDILAVDVTYRLQISSDLSTWTTLAESANGAEATGPGFVSETSNPNLVRIRTVNVRDTLPASTAGKRFLRLLVTR